MKLNALFTKLQSIEFLLQQQNKTSLATFQTCQAHKLSKEALGLVEAEMVREKRRKVGRTC